MSSERIKLIETPDNYQGKIKLIRGILEDVKNKKQAQNKMPTEKTMYKKDKDSMRHRMNATRMLHSRLQGDGRGQCHVKERNKKTN